MVRKKLSDLPEFIIQHIQSFLDHRQAVRTTMLSKLWLRAWSTSPTLLFHPSKFSYPGIDPQDSYQLQQQKKQEQFSKMVDDTLLRYQQHRLLMEKLSLAVEVTDVILVSSVNRWLQIAAQSGLRELVLDFLPWRFDKFFVLPFWIFPCPTFETVKVSGCQMETPADDQMIKCCSLINLRLQDVRIGDQLIHMLISNCGLIENINLSWYQGLKKIHFGNLPMLKDLKVSGKVYGSKDTKVCKLDSRCSTNLIFSEVTIDNSVLDELSLDCIQSLNLYCVEFQEVKLGKLHCFKELRISGTRINLRELESRSLGVLKLTGFDVDEPELDQLFRRCPSIEDVTLNDCNGHPKVKAANIRFLKCFQCAFGTKLIDTDGSSLHLKRSKCAFGTKLIDIVGPSLRAFSNIYGP